MIKWIDLKKEKREKMSGTCCNKGSKRLISACAGLANTGQMT